MRRFNRINIISYSLVFLAVLTLFSTVYFIYNIKVLEDWKLTVNTTDIHVGDTVVLESSYNKLRPVSGEAIRYIECKNKSGVWIRYELNRATSNRKAGRGGTGIPLTIRRDIADVPTTCKFSIVIRYDVLPFRDVHVTNSTTEFMLLTERAEAIESSSASPQVTTQRSQSQVQPVPVSNLSSSPQSTPQETTVLPENSQTPPEEQYPPIATEPPPSNILPFVETCITPIRILGGCL